MWRKPSYSEKRENIKFLRHLFLFVTRICVCVCVWAGGLNPGFGTNNFAQFDHPLLQLTVGFEVGMRSSSPEELISQRKSGILLLRINTQQESSFNTTLLVPLSRSFCRKKGHSVKLWQKRISQGELIIAGELLHSSSLPLKKHVQKSPSGRKHPRG